MSRLTQKTPKVLFPRTGGMVYCYTYHTTEKDKCDVAIKLGQLEDIEEELGIDLITLFKALKDGIYYKYYLRMNAEPLQKIDVCLGKDVEDKWCLHTWYLSSWNCNIEDVCIYFDEYGKSWALTKKELEQ